MKPQKMSEPCKATYIIPSPFAAGIGSAALVTFGGGPVGADFRNGNPLRGAVRSVFDLSLGLELNARPDHMINR